VRTRACACGVDKSSMGCMLSSKTTTTTAHNTHRYGAQSVHQGVLSRQAAPDEPRLGSRRRRRRRHRFSHSRLAFGDTALGDKAAEVAVGVTPRQDGVTARTRRHAGDKVTKFGEGDALVFAMPVVQARAHMAVGA